MIQLLLVLSRHSQTTRENHCCGDGNNAGGLLREKFAQKQKRSDPLEYRCDYLLFRSCKAPVL
jgi:hypothetical protein